MSTYQIQLTLTIEADGLYQANCLATKIEDILICDADLMDSLMNCMVDSVEINEEDWDDE